MNPLIKSLITAAKKIALATVPGAQPALEAFESFKAVAEQVKQLVNPEPQEAAELDAEIDALQAHVFAHADRTAAELRDPG